MRHLAQFSSSSRHGGALVLALVVLVACLSLLAGVQSTLNRRNTRLRILRNEVALESALLLGLQRATALLAADDDLVVDHAGEDWALPREFNSSDGVRLRMEMSDAQAGFDLNRLRRPPLPGEPRGGWDMLEDLLSAAEIPVDPEGFRGLRERILEEEAVFASPEALVAFDPATAPWLESGLPFTALPSPQTGPLPVNLNTVEPAVLRALVGPSLIAWADTVLAAREQEPLKSVSTQTQFLPPPVAALLGRTLSVNTRHFELRLEAETDHTVARLEALLRRNTGGDVEVLSCRW